MFTNLFTDLKKIGLTAALTLTMISVPASPALAQEPSIIDRIPSTTTTVVTEAGGSTFLAQLIYAGVIVWIVSLLRSGKR
jgi:hypothetical protein